MPHCGVGGRAKSNRSSLMAGDPTDRDGRAGSLRPGRSRPFGLSRLEACRPFRRVLRSVARPPPAPGESARDVTALAFASLTLVRPGLLGGERDHPRLAESLGLVAAGALGKLLPAIWRISSSPQVAAALVAGVVAGHPGCRVISSADLA